VNPYKVLAITGILAALVLAALPVHAELPGYQQYAIPASVDELRNYIYSIVGNVSITGSNGVFTISDVKDNKTSVILLNPAFGYRLEGSGRVGLAYANGTVALSFDLSQGPVEIISHELFTSANKTASAAAYPAIILADGNQASIKIIVELKPTSVSLSAPSPPFQGMVWQGRANPSAGHGFNVFIAQRDVSCGGQLRVAFWEAHRHQDLDLLIYRGSALITWIFSDDAQWHSKTLGAGSYTLKVRQFAVWGSTADPWMVVYQCQASNSQPTPQPHPQPEPQPTQTPGSTVTHRDKPSAPVPSAEAKTLLIGAGIVAVAIIFAVALARK